jgi:hypothetical protein
VCICLCGGYAGACGACHIGWCARDHAPPPCRHAHYYAHTHTHALSLLHSHHLQVGMCVCLCVCECVSVNVVGMLVLVVLALLDGVQYTPHHLGLDVCIWKSTLILFKRIAALHFICSSYYEHVSAHAHTHIHTYMCAHTHTHMSTHIRVSKLHTRMHTHTHTYTHTGEPHSCAAATAGGPPARPAGCKEPARRGEGRECWTTASTASVAETPSPAPTALDA